MVNKTGVLSASFVICGWLLFTFGFTVASWIAYYPKGVDFSGEYVPTYAYFENISGGLPLMSLGITLSIAGVLIAFHNQRSVNDRLKNYRA